MMASGNLIHQMRGTQFPFGVLNIDQSQLKKVFVKKRYPYRDQDEYDQLQAKIDKLKTISHKNTINLRSTEQTHSAIDLLYQYVPHSIEDSFHENLNQTVKDMHRQFIQLAIFLAKHCIITPFNPQRCGVLINQNRSTLKYYLPLHDITITDNRNVIERSVQLFNVQSMHYLDTLTNSGLNTTTNESCSQRTFKNRVKLFPNRPDKHRRDSQPSSLFKSNQRRLSNNPNQNSQIRKLSTLSKELSEISQIHKRNRASTRGSGGSFNTFQSILSLKSQKNMSIRERTQEVDNSKSILKRCMSLNGFETQKIQNVITRSRKALNTLKTIQENITSYKGLYEVIKRLHTQY